MRWIAGMLALGGMALALGAPGSPLKARRTRTTERTREETMEMPTTARRLEKATFAAG